MIAKTNGLERAQKTDSVFICKSPGVSTQNTWSSEHFYEAGITPGHYQVDLKTTKTFL